MTPHRDLKYINGTKSLKTTMKKEIRQANIEHHPKSETVSLKQQLTIFPLIIYGIYGVCFDQFSSRTTHI